ncbi:uncharacterized protein BYT42DRAFT_556233 [Radiomyces spectabilis]|uniref:uncharacterized protein n=1 Tax=Radiomyces spectabilis TaxID=64574 RepID=UPI002220F953|nr:uncharacterized protein BYT42DRAFT_556233 [Radiomyces spectabilis]KAI8391266.1 hypothetical protein BYT42DRAFT_556233 [Radiomyces spectabilis]
MNSIQALIYEAAECLGCGNLQSSYELYLQALSSAVNELYKIKFVDQYVAVRPDHLVSIFVLARTCLQYAEDITNKRPTTSFMDSKVLVDDFVELRTPPPLPPKPKSMTLKKTAPPLPARPKYKLSMHRPQAAHALTPAAVTITSSAPLKSPQPCSVTSEHEDEEDEEDEDVEDDLDIAYLDDEDEDDDMAAAAGRQRSIKPRVIARRSSTSNLTENPVSTSSSSNINAFLAVKSFLSLPASIPTHVDALRKLNQYPSTASLSSDERFCEQDDIFLPSNLVIDPTQLVAVQTSSGDRFVLPTTAPVSEYVPAIPQAPLLSVYRSMQLKLEDLEKYLSALKQEKKDGTHLTQEAEDDLDSSTRHYVASIAEVKGTLSRVRNIHMSATTVPTILQFPPMLIAYQLTLIDSTIFRNIPPEALQQHTLKTPHPAIVASTDFFNYLTRLIEHSILLQQEASGRAQHINHWIKVANKCHDLRNFQTLKAITSALRTPPIQRLKRTWAFLPKKSLLRLEEITELMSEANNYGKYRERLDALVTVETIGAQQKTSPQEPAVPFLGLFIHDMTYLTALQKSSSEGGTSTSSNQTGRLADLLKAFRGFQQSPPYPPGMAAHYTKDFHKNRRRKLSYALRGGASTKKHPVFSTEEDTGDTSVEMQQCLMTQYLLTRPWVCEKTVDDMSLLREPPKTMRSQSTGDALSGLPIVTASTGAVPAVPCSTATNSPSNGELRSSSGSLTCGVASSTESTGSSRPVSLEDDTDIPMVCPSAPDCKQAHRPAFWLFARKWAEHHPSKTEMGSYGPGSSASDNESVGSIQRSPRYYSLEDVDHSHDKSHLLQREGSFSSQTSLATSIFRKDFWRHSAASQTGSPRSSMDDDNSRSAPTSVPTLSKKSTALQSHTLNQSRHQYKSSPSLFVDNTSPVSAMNHEAPKLRRRSSSSSLKRQSKAQVDAASQFARHTISRSKIKHMLSASYLSITPHPLDPPALGHDPSPTSAAVRCHRDSDKEECSANLQSLFIKPPTQQFERRKSTVFTRNS